MELAGEFLDTYRAAQKQPLLSAAERSGAMALDRQGIERILPHRDPFLFLDRVTTLDVERGLIACRYPLPRDHRVFTGHFPGEPYWPGVLQLEMFAQAACLLHLKIVDAEPGTITPLTEIYAARFIRKVGLGEVEILARWFDDGLFFVAVGQCLQDGNICSVAAMQGLK